MRASSPAFMWLADFLGIFTLVALLWRYVIRPQWVKLQQDTVVEPLEQVLKALTKNGGKNYPPTVPDTFEKVFQRLDAQDELAERREKKFSAWRRKQDERLSALEETVREQK